MISFWLVIVLVLLTGEAVFSEVVFEDTFENGSVEDSESEEGFWTYSILVGAGGTATESDDKLVLTGPRPNNISSSMVQSQPSREFDFFKRRLIFQVHMIPGGDTENPQSECAIFFISSNSGTIYKGGTENAFVVEFRRETDVRVRSKAGKNSEMVNLKTSGIVAPVGFELTIDDMSFRLVVFQKDGSSQELSGWHNLKSSDWGDREYSIAFMTVKGGKQPGKASSIIVDDIKVTTSVL